MNFRNPFTSQLNPDLTPITEPETPVTDPIATLPTYNPETQTVIEKTKLAAYVEIEARYHRLTEKINRIQFGFRNFLRGLWESGLDKDELNSVFEDHGQPTAEKEFVFTATVSIQVNSIIGKGANVEEAWENVDDDAIREAFENGNYDTWSIDKPYHSDDAEENEDGDAAPDYDEASIYNLQ